MCVDWLFCKDYNKCIRKHGIRWNKSVKTYYLSKEENNYYIRKHSIRWNKSLSDMGRQTILWKEIIIIYENIVFDENIVYVMFVMVYLLNYNNAYKGKSTFLCHIKFEFKNITMKYWLKSDTEQNIIKEYPDTKSRKIMSTTHTLVKHF